MIGVFTFGWLFFVPSPFSRLGDLAAVEQETWKTVATNDKEGGPKAVVNEGPSSIKQPSWEQLERGDAALEPRQPSVSGRRSTTIVSAFFDMNKIGLKTKHDPSFYLTAGRDGVLSFDTPCVFFTDSPEETARALRRAWKTHPSSLPVPDTFKIINISLMDLDVTKKHLKRIAELVPNDPEARAYGYSAELFTIYHAKPEMMRIAAEMNPFNTERFLWMDVGAVRDWGGIDAAEYRFTQFPNPSREHLIGRDGRIVMGAVAGRNGTCPDNVRWVDAEHPEATNGQSRLQKVRDPLEVPPERDWWIAGAIWGGHKDSLREYESLYRHHLARYLARSDESKFALIDQYLMGALACHSDLIEVVRPPLACCVDRVNRKWFFMLMYLKDQSYPRAPYTPAELAKRPLSSHCQYCDLVEDKKP